ncbi:MAG: ATP-dependent sacrificial sulfur transferase LarE, partial [Methanomicrobiales archaeon]|nr:ATP-dependent sacrificial sulfur transferase LarE [Methanomicrobiales archaeon]
LIDSPVVPRSAVREAQALAGELGLWLDIIEAPLLDHADFCKNPVDRCYICKKDFAARLRTYADGTGLTCMADGANVSDTGEHRPGLRAADEEGIVHPLVEAGIDKADVREIAKLLSLRTWSKPSAACLVSRIPYGETITMTKLHTVEEAETFLATLGIGQLRVRLHGNLARIEVNKEDWEKILKHQFEITVKFRSLDIAYTTLDLEGYRTGSMDEILHP